MAVLVRIVDSIRHKELGRQTGRRSSPKEQTPTAQAGTGKEVGKKVAAQVFGDRRGRPRIGPLLKQVKNLPCFC